MARRDPAATLCGNCGHWSESSESGLSHGTGYCDYWEKLVDKGHKCDFFVTQADYDAYQRELAEKHEDYLED